MTQSDRSDTSCPVPTKSARSASLTCGEESLLADHCGPDVWFAGPAGELSQGIRHFGVPVVLAEKPTDIPLTCGGSAGSWLPPKFVGSSPFATGTPLTTRATPEQTRAERSGSDLSHDAGFHINAVQMHIRWIFRQDYWDPSWARSASRPPPPAAPPSGSNCSRCPPPSSPTHWATTTRPPPVCSTRPAVNGADTPPEITQSHHHARQHPQLATVEYASPPGPGSGAASWPRPAAPAAALIAWGRDLLLAPVVAREPRAAAHG